MFWFDRSFSNLILLTLFIAEHVRRQGNLVRAFL